MSTSCIVTYTDRAGNTVKSAIMPEKVAAMYAKTVKNAVVTPVDAQVPEVAVKVCKPATLDDLKAASKAYYDKHWNPRVNNDLAQPTSDENRAEMEHEYVTQAMLQGVSANDALADLDGWTRG